MRLSRSPSRTEQLTLLMLAQLYEEIQELKRLQQQAMYELERPVPFGTDLGSPAEAARANVAAYETMLAVSFANPTVEALLAAFTALPLKAD